MSVVRHRSRGRRKGSEPVEHRVEYDLANEALLDTMAAHAFVIASVVDSRSDDVGGFHPVGSADGTGFAAMACDELLIHTEDAATGLGLHFVSDSRPRSRGREPTVPLARRCRP